MYCRCSHTHQVWVSHGRDTRCQMVYKVRDYSFGVFFDLWCCLACAPACVLVFACTCRQLVLLFSFSHRLDSSDRSSNHGAKDVFQQPRLSEKHPDKHQIWFQPVTLAGFVNTLKISWIAGKTCENRAFFEYLMFDSRRKRLFSLYQFQDHKQLSWHVMCDSSLLKPFLFFSVFIFKVSCPNRVSCEAVSESLFSSSHWQKQLADRVAPDGDS